jgi:hypothetical protein
MDILRIIALSEVAAGVLIAWTWLRVVRRGNFCADWRHRASLAALVLASIALAIQFAVVASFPLLKAHDPAGLRGGWNEFVGYLWLGSFFATGLLAFCGIVLAILGKGSPRIAAGLWSFGVFGMFLVNLVLFINAFH